jgi:selenide,water dikinase
VRCHGPSLTLTDQASGAGGGSKLGKDLLLDAPGAMRAAPEDPRILVGTERLDDACVHRLRDDLALVASVDFSPPMVDDPGTLGTVAAINALSDLYAIGATPTLALVVGGRSTRPRGAPAAAGHRARRSPGCEPRTSSPGAEP